MELFARDQDLVRQATESARLKAESKQQQQIRQQQAQTEGQPNTTTMVPSSNQHPMMKAPSNALAAVPSLNSWPHFSSITSLNNLGTIPGVKSITSMSGIDLTSKGNVNKMGNIANIKSMESMGRNDSYAYLELFFGDRSSTSLSGMGGGPSMTGLSNKGSSMGNMKHHGEEDNEIGLSLEDESPSHITRKEYMAQSSLNQSSSFAMLASVGEQAQQDTGYLKRAYDDALAARGLMSVSRSCEKLTDLDLPAKIQRTLSQEFLNIEQEQQMRQKVQQQKDMEYMQQQQSSTISSHQYSGDSQGNEAGEGSSVNANMTKDGQVQVASTTACSLCGQTNIDTQLRPCGHMFHERCLKPALITSSGEEQQPRCPMDNITINSAVLAIPETSFR
jgi:Zinc finger, C3HC4 type (RING finger)